MCMVSIVIPVYNAEKYIEECLNSLLNQSYTDFEIICVNDGSSDNSYKILKEYEGRDNRIMAMTQKKQNAGVARNVGKRRARGKYLLFLDADDFFCENMLERVVNKAEENSTEILVFNSYIYDNMKNIVISNSSRYLNCGIFGEGIKPSTEISDVIYTFGNQVVWNKLMLKEYIDKNDFQFQSVPRGNDMLFVSAALSCAESIGVLNERLMYHRTNRAESLVGGIDETPLAYMEALCAVKNFLVSKGIEDKFKIGFNNLAAKAFTAALGRIKSFEIYDQVCERIANEVVPQLNLGINAVNEKIERAIQRKQDIIIYGAGMFANALIKMLIYKCKYNTNQLVVAVTDASDNAETVCGVKVLGIEELDVGKEGSLVVIAVSDISVQNLIEKNLLCRGYKNISKMNEKEMLDFVSYIYCDNGEI